MDIKTVSAMRRLRLVSVPEAVSFLLLLVCSVLKRTTEFNAVPVMGAIHGFLFVLYVLFLLDAWNRTKWSIGTAVLYFVLSVLPAGGFFAGTGTVFTSPMRRISCFTPGAHGVPFCIDTSPFAFVHL